MDILLGLEDRPNVQVPEAIFPEVANIPAFFTQLIKNLLQNEATKRMSIEEAHEELKGYLEGELSTSTG